VLPDLLRDHDAHGQVESLKAASVGDAAVGCARAQSSAAPILCQVSVFAGFADVLTGDLSGGALEVVDRQDAAIGSASLVIMSASGRPRNIGPGEGAPAGLADAILRREDCHIISTTSYLWQL
jgi:hypothetical protein